MDWRFRRIVAFYSVVKTDNPRRVFRNLQFRLGRRRSIAGYLYEMGSIFRFVEQTLIGGKRKNKKKNSR